MASAELIKACNSVGNSVGNYTYVRVPAKFFCLRALKDGIMASNIKSCNSVGNYTYVRVSAKALWPGHI